MNNNGFKVKINTEQILNRERVSDKYKEFIVNNRETIFTALLDIDNKYTKMYILKEDTSEIKWLFHIDDLILV